MSYRENLSKNASSKTFINARILRKVTTPAEQVLWEALRGQKLGGFKFRRQHPIANFVADFYCHEKQVVIELDGQYHQQNDQPERDEWRTEELKNLGIQVIRFANEDVENQLENVLIEILAQLKTQLKL